MISLYTGCERDSPTAPPPIIVLTELWNIVNDFLAYVLFWYVFLFQKGVLLLVLNIDFLPFM